MKFGKIKRQHGRVGGLDSILDRIVGECPWVSRIVPGRIKVRRGKTPPRFRVQYPTPGGLKCLYNGTGTVQEVFLICTDAEKARGWLIEQGIAEKDEGGRMKDEEDMGGSPMPRGGGEMIGGRELISKAVQTLRGGGLVAFPTETVYGLGGDATNAAAVEKIYRAKGRPSTNPLIVHVADGGIAKRYAKRWTGEAEKLAERFWPGPLALVVMKQETIAGNVTAGRPTVGLRVPSHPLALELLREFDGPVAAPSANRSNRVSPTTAEHVNSEIGTAIDLILDGGECQVGIESTVVDLTGVRPVILRPGMITKEQIEEVVGGEVKAFVGSVKEGEAASSPGQMTLHYAPNAAAYRFEKKDLKKAMDWCRGEGREQAWAMLVIGNPSGEVAMFQDEMARGAKGVLKKVVGMPGDAEGYARRLYATLREMDRLKVGVIWIEMPPEKGGWAALRDRLMRATKEGGGGESRK